MTARSAQKGKKWSKEMNKSMEKLSINDDDKVENEAERQF